jgi:hypothetical protein
MHYLLSYVGKSNKGMEALYRKYNKHGVFASHMGPFLKTATIGEIGPYD